MAIVITKAGSEDPYPKIVHQAMLTVIKFVNQARRYPLRTGWERINRSTKMDPNQVTKGMVHCPVENKVNSVPIANQRKDQRSLSG
jgi:hypothetical protein